MVTVIIERVNGTWHTLKCTHLFHINRSDIVYDHKVITNYTILGVAAVLDPPLIISVLSPIIFDFFQ